VILLDAYGLVALLAGEPSADEVELVLRRGDSAVTAVNLAEALDVLQRVHRLSEREIRGPVEPLLAGPLRVIPMGAELSWRSAALRARHYHRRSAALSLADCVLLAAAGPADAVATSDPPLAAAARAEGIDVRPLPDSRGRQP